MPPPTNSSWTVPEGQPPPPDDPPPPHDGPPPLPDGPPPPQCHLPAPPSAPQETERPNFTYRSHQQRPPPGLPAHLAPPPCPPTPRISINHIEHGDGGAQNNLRSWDDDMDLDDGGTPSPGTGRQGGGTGRHGVASRPPQPPPPRENTAQAGMLPMPGPPPMPSRQVQPQQLPTVSSTPPAPAVPHPRQQVFAPPVFSPPSYAHVGPANAVATKPAVIATSAPPNFHVVHGGVGLATPSAATAAPASPAGTRPAPVTLPLGSVARPPAVITTARTGGAATGGPPLFSPQELTAAAMAINNARATLAMRRENPVTPATPTFIPENPAHPGGQQFHPVRDQGRGRRGSHDHDDGSSRQHQHQGPPPPPYHSWGPG